MRNVVAAFATLPKTAEEARMGLLALGQFLPLAGLLLLIDP